MITKTEVELATYTAELGTHQQVEMHLARWSMTVSTWCPCKGVFCTCATPLRQQTIDENEEG